MNEETKELGDIQDLEGHYADAFRIGYSAYKFVLDFGQFSSPTGETHFHTRIIVGPHNAKAFMERLDQSLREYEGRFSEITQSDK